MMHIDAGESLAHTPTPYLSKQMNGPRSSLSPIHYQLLSSPHRETIVFDLSIGGRPAAGKSIVCGFCVGYLGVLCSASFQGLRIS